MKTPEAKIYNFIYNPETKYFEQSEYLVTNKIPLHLKLEEIQKPDIIKGATHILQSRIVNGKRLFFTGLRSTGFSNWYYGDHYQTKSFILFHFTKDSQKFTAHYFNGFKKYPNHRAKFIREYLNRLGEL